VTSRDDDDDRSGSEVFEAAGSVGRDVEAKSRRVDDAVDKLRISDGDLWRRVQRLGDAEKMAGC
jgi:hypothetical protein